MMVREVVNVDQSSFEEQLDSAMADQLHNNSSMESGSSPGSSAGDQTSSGYVAHPGSGGNACETSMWEEWTQATSTGDEMSTSNFLPDLSTSSISESSRLSFQQSDMLSTWMSTFHPLAHPSLISPDPVDDHPPAFMQEAVLALDPEKLHHEMEDAADALPLVYDSKTTGVSRQLLRALGPLSPSSPLAIHNGLLNPLGDPWDGCPSTSLQWSTVTTTGQTYNGHSARSTFFPDHSASAIDHLEGITTTTRSYASKPRHTDIFIGPNGTIESTPGGWTPQLLYDGSETKVGSASVTPMKLMASLREAGEATSCEVYAKSTRNGPQEIELVNLSGGGDRSTSVTSSTVGNMVTMAGMLEECKRDSESTMTTQVVWPQKHRLELVELADGEDVDVKSSPPLLKRPRISSPVDSAKALQWSDQTLRGAELRSFCPPSGGGSLASQAMDMIAIGPALNTNGKPRARRGSATDPQSVYARHRREKINERLKNLQNLVPNGAKVDIVTMLDEAIHYVKFMQHQVELLKSDDYWMYATPNNYNGMDLSELCTHSQELESSA